MIRLEVFEVRDVYFQTELFVLESALADEDWSSTSECVERMSCYPLTRKEKREIRHALDEIFNMSTSQRRHIASLLRN